MCTSEILDEIVSREIEACTLSFDGVPASKDNCKQAKNLFQMFFALLISIRAKYYDDPFSEKEIFERIPFFFEEDLDIKLFIAELLKVDEYLLSISHPATVETTWYDFNHHISSFKERKRITMIFKLLKRPVCAFLHGCVYSLKDIRSMTNFLKKASFDRDDLLYDALTQFLDREDNLTYCPEIVANLQSVLNEKMSSFELKPLDFNISNGATADSANGDLFDKINKIEMPKDIHDTLEKKDLYTFNSWHLFPVSDKTSRDYQCVLQWVKKTYKALRLIAKQPLELMVGQQAIMTQLYEFIEHDPYYRKRVPLNNSEVSRELCLKTSLTGEFATVDMSAASDTIHQDLIKAFPTDIQEMLELFRCKSYVISDRDAEKINRHCEAHKLTSPLLTEAGQFHKIFVMFAPMGSATTFPVLSLLMAAACELACRWSQTENDFVVFGDDIIIRQTALIDLYRILDMMGFTVNRDKSFAGLSRFRESCGMDAYRGVDVTPLRVSRTLSPYERKPKHTSETYSTIRALRMLKDDKYCPSFLKSMAPYIELYNQSVTFGYNYLRNYVLKRRITPCVPFSSDGTRGLFSPYPTNFHLPRSFDYDANGFRQCEYVVSLGVFRCLQRPQDIGTLNYDESQDATWLAVWFYLAYKRECEIIRRSTRHINDRVYHRVNWFLDEPVTANSCTSSKSGGLPLLEVRLTRTPVYRI